MFWILTVLLFLLASLFVIVPLWSRTRSGSDRSVELRNSANIALFQERSDELEADLSAGNIDQQQFDSLLLELQHNLLTDTGREDQPPANQIRSLPENKKNNKPDQGALNPVPSRPALSVVIPCVLALLIPLLAYPLYYQWGFFDDVQVMDLFQATVDNDGDPEQAQRLIISIGTFARENPDMPWSFYFLGENFASIGMLEEAQMAYTRAAELLEPSAEKALVLGRVATFMYINSDLRITADVQRVIDQVREINPGEIAVLQLLAADAEQRQDLQSLIEYSRLLIQASPNSEMAQESRIRIGAAQRMLAASDPDSATGPAIDVNLSLPEGLELDPGLRVFVAARNAEREGMPPLAAIDTTVAELPATIRLDNSSAVGPFNLASADSIYVSALISFANTATASSGDYRVVSENFSHDGEQKQIDLVISERIP